MKDLVGSNFVSWFLETVLIPKMYSSTVPIV